MNQIVQAAQLACHDIYDPVTPQVFDKLYRVGETVCGIALIDGHLFIANQGTENTAGWEADGDIVPTAHPTLGNLHTGFYRNIVALIKLLAIDIAAEFAVDIPIVVTGHSKGAGEAALLGACLKLAGFNVVQAILFACPRPGYQGLANWLHANLPGISFRNAPSDFPALGDPVPMVPINPYVEPYSHVMIDVAPGGLQDFDPFARHAAELYRQGACAWGSVQ
jgi:hypothetical protein